jgi:hypothetical protein
MKKIMLILVVLIQTILFAQSKQTIEKPLKLTSVAVGTLSDDVLLRGTVDQEVKRISVSNLLLTSGNQTKTGTLNITNPIGGGTALQINNSLTATGKILGVSKNGSADVLFINDNGNITANSYIKTGGTASQFLKANGTIDNTLYASLESPVFTGTPTAPTQTAGNNTKAVATTEFLVQNAVLLTGNQTKKGVLSFNNTTSGLVNGILLTNSGANYGSWSLSISNTSSGGGSYINNSGPGYGNYIVNSSSGVGSFTSTSGGGYGSYINSIASTALFIQNNSTGKGLVINNFGAATAMPFTIQKNEIDKLTINDSGIVTAVQYNVSALNTAPASATATGVLGEIRYTATYIYVCTATNTWVRSALTTW